jgi:hypothetical protein
MSFKLSKTYNNRKAASQTGNYSILLYEGIKEGRKFQGDWAFKGFEGVVGSSGSWSIVEV